MPLTERNIDALLYQAESETLDFKREQYRFYGIATDSQKSEPAGHPHESPVDATHTPANR